MFRLEYRKLWLFVTSFSIGIIIYLGFHSDIHTQNRIYGSETVGAGLSHASRYLSKIRTRLGRPPPGTINPPGIVAKIDLGLGNQLFRFASSYALARQLGVPLYLVIPEDPGKIENLRNPFLRQYVLDAFNLTSPKVDIYKIGSKMWEKIMKKDGGQTISQYTCYNFFFERIKEDLVETHLLHSPDFCHSEKYFEDYILEVQNMLRFSQKFLDFIENPKFFEWSKMIKDSSASAAIHVRRGDYVNQEYWPTPMSFYEKAISTMVEKFCDRKVTFFIFSDDIDFVKKNLSIMYEPTNKGKKCKNFPDFHYVSSRLRDGNHEITSLEEFVLMTMCQNIIISNSAFGWWAAYLISNPKKIVIGPTFHPKFLQHLKNGTQKKFKTFMMKAFKYPEGWITLDPFNGKGL